MMKIVTLDELLSISKDGEYEIVADIDCNYVKVPCLGSVFRGVLEGNNHVVKNLVIEDPIWGDEQKIALFRHLTRATIRNIRFENIAFNIEKGVYKPSVSGLGVDVSDSCLENVYMALTTADGSNIPLIYESVGGSSGNLSYLCNNISGKIYEYKEGVSV